MLEFKNSSADCTAYSPLLFLCDIHVGLTSACQSMNQPINEECELFAEPITFFVQWNQSTKSVNCSLNQSRSLFNETNQRRVWTVCFLHSLKPFNSVRVWFLKQIYATHQQCVFVSRVQREQIQAKQLEQEAARLKNCGKSVKITRDGLRPESPTGRKPKRAPFRRLNNAPNRLKQEVRGAYRFCACQRPVHSHLCC